MSLGRRLSLTFLPIIAVPLVAVIIIQLVLTQNYVLNSESEVMRLEAQLLKSEFQLDYARQLELQIVELDFFRNRLLNRLYDEFTPEDPRSRGLLVVDGNGNIVRPDNLDSLKKIPIQVVEELHRAIDANTVVQLPGGFGYPLDADYLVTGFHHDLSDLHFLIYDDNSRVIESLTQSGIIMLFIGLITLTIAGFFITWASQKLTKPIVELTNVVTQFGNGMSDVRSEVTSEGEVGILSREFNVMADRLEQFTGTLENTLEMRTNELRRKMRQLGEAQQQLVETEKMASLGGLVAGFAHELNTPLGVTVTAAGYVDEAAAEALAQIESGEVSKSELLKNIRRIQEAAALITTNTGRASEMVTRFKHVAADQYFEELKEINMLSFLTEIRDTLITILKPARAELEILCDKEATVQTYPGVLWQILSNLCRNSLHHAFAEKPAPEDSTVNQVTIVYAEEELFHTLYFCDNGPGIPRENRNKIFNPFFTTGKENGNTGLGLHIVRNLVAQKFKGKFTYVPEEDRQNNQILPSSGACFSIILPKSINKIVE